MAADDSRRLVIDLSAITEESVTEETLVGNHSTGQTEGVVEGMDVACGDTDMEGFQTVKRKRRASPGQRALSDSAKKVRVEHERTIDLAVYMKGSSENLACPKNARNIRDAIVKTFGLVERIQVAGESLRILCKSEAQKAEILNSKTLQNSGKVIHILCTLPFCRTEEGKKARPANRAVISGIDVLMTEDEIVKELQEARVSKVVRICKSQNGVKTPTSSVILFFDSNDIPDKVHVGWRSCKVKEYRANPLRCYICSRFGHKAASCNAKKPRCARCSEAHDVKECKAGELNFKCANCHGNHPSYDRECPSYKEAKIVANIALKNKMLFSEVVQLRRAEKADEVSGVVTDPISHSRNRYQRNPEKSTPTQKRQPVRRQLAYNPAQGHVRVEAPQVSSTPIGEISQVTALESCSKTLQNPSINNQAGSGVPVKSQGQSNYITKQELLTRLVGYHSHILNIVSHYVPEHIRAEMVSNLVYRSYKCFNINVSELCPSLPGKAPSPCTVATPTPTGK